jgi:hypothetical protein
LQFSAEEFDCVDHGFETVWFGLAAAYAPFREGHVPIGVHMALPVIESARHERYATIMMPLSLSLTKRCDAVLRIGGASKGADEEVERFRSRGLTVFTSLDETPPATTP